MSHALWISIGAVALAAVIVAAVTWMLVSSGRVGRHGARVLPGSPPPLHRAALLFDRFEAVEAPACAEEDDLDRELLRARLEETSKTGDEGRAYRLAKVLARLGDEDPSVISRSNAREPVPAVFSPIGDEDWVTSVASPGLDRALTGLMALLGPEVITWHAHPAGRYGLARGERVENQPKAPRLAELAPMVARAVGVPAPQLYLTPQRDARLVHVNLSVAGRFASALAVGKEGLSFEDESIMLFMLGRKLTFMRPEHLLCTAVDGPEDLRALHLAVAQVLDPGTLPEPPAIVLGKVRSEALSLLRQYFGEADLAAAMRRLLRLSRERFVEEEPSHSGRWERWLVASAETSFRLGLLLCGDLRAGLKILDLDGVIPGTHREHVQCYQALYRFYLSDEYARLRRILTG
ncbi:MAG: hypothetical protein RBU30_25665 [Polyangia bacterium]|nr:hypothetical protein [Polyangia bacterium]